MIAIRGCSLRNYTDKNTNYTDNFNNVISYCHENGCNEEVNVHDGKYGDFFDIFSALKEIKLEILNLTLT